MQNEDFSDRRVFARIPITLPIRILAEGKDEEYRGQTIDISANGIGLMGKEQLSPQTSLEMWLELPNNQGPFYTRGEVIWSSSLDEVGKQRLGIHLDKAELMGLAPLLWR